MVLPLGAAARRAAVATTAVAALLVTHVTAVAAPVDDGPVAAGITVAKVDGLSENFINGVDVSSVLALEASGVVFRDAGGQPADLFETLADAGVTWVRVRVWNDPWTADGHGYGGGNNDVEAAAEIGRRATAAGLDLLVDLHYSDFWADPGKYKAPKAWASMSLAEKETATYEFTRDALETIEAAGADVDMVQVGNETNNGVAGVTGMASMAKIFSAGSRGVREAVPDAKVAVHFTNPERGTFPGFAKQLADNGVDYDVFGASYYPFWHGTLTNLTSTLTTVAQTYGKEVAVLETSWARTLVDADGHENVIKTAYSQYPISVQGQATAVRDVMAAVSAVPDGKGLGVFYWEPAWLPVGPASALESNKVLWERDGSGWAASYAGEYDANDAGTWYGGSAWDNQSLFADDGTPLESLSVFRYARTGAVSPRSPESVTPVTVTGAAGSPVVLPTTVTLVFSDGTSEPVEVTWSGAQDWIRGAGTFTVTGTTASGLVAVATVTLTDTAAVQHLVNPSFETGSEAPWTTTLGSVKTSSDAIAGTKALNYYSATGGTILLQQVVAGLDEGRYTMSIAAHGLNPAGTPLEVFATSDDGTVSAPMVLADWGNVVRPSVEVVVGASGTATVGLRGTVDAAGWGWVDDASFVVTPAAGADTSGLAALVARADALRPGDWTVASFEPVRASLEIAHVVLAGSFPAEADVDTVTASLAASLDGLVGYVTALGATVSRTDYAFGEAFDPATVTVTGTLAAGGTRPLAAGEFTVTGYEARKAGAQTLVVQATADVPTNSATAPSTTVRVVVGAEPTPDPTETTAPPTTAPPTTAPPTTVPSKVAVSLSLARTRIAYGSTTSVKVRVVGATAAPSGTVVVYDGTRRIATARLTVSGRTGRATVRIPKNLAVRTHTLRAVYAGSRTTAAGRSATARLVVTKARPSMSASVRSNRLVVRVSAPGLPSGTYVTVKAKGRTLGRAKVVKGVAKVRLTSLPAGRHTLSVRIPSSAKVAARTISVKVSVTKKPTVVRKR